MPKTLGKTIHHCLSKLKRSSTVQSPPTIISTKDQNRPSATKTSSSYGLTSTSATNDFSSSSLDYSDIETTPPDLATVFATQRFFFSSPGRSNSIIDPGRFSDASQCPAPESDTIITGGIPTTTYSPNPYVDFRRSMQEMVEAAKFLGVRADANYLHELLLSYLKLNPKNTHKFIIDAFTDVLVSLITAAPAGVRLHGSDIQITV